MQRFRKKATLSNMNDATKLVVIAVKAQLVNEFEESSGLSRCEVRLCQLAIFR